MAASTEGDVVQKEEGDQPRVETPKVTSDDNPTASRAGGDPRSVSDVLTRAADIVERGWCQGVYSRGAECVCAKGSIMRAADVPHLSPMWDPLPSHDDVSLVARAKAYLVALMPPPLDPEECPIAAWNDALERTQAEVVAKLREAAALALAEATHV